MRNRERLGWHRYINLVTVSTVLIVLFVLLPMYWLITTSFKDPNTITQTLQLFPSKGATTASYSSLFKTGVDFQRNIVNSVVVSLVSTALVLFFGVLAGYGLGRTPMKGKLAILMVLLMISVFPSIAVISPLFVIFRDLNWINSYQALILPYTAFNLPFAVWILRNYFQGIPREMEETGRIDGAGPLKTLWAIILPQATPGLFTAGIFAFTACWTEYLIALNLDPSDNYHTIPVAIANLPAPQYAVPYGPIFAASCVAAVPVGVLVLIFRKSVVSGLTAGAVKG
jgi:multiple sugar transport system permease protein